MRALAGVFFVFCILSLGHLTAQAQPKKGDKEVFLLTGNSFIGLGDSSGAFTFNASGQLGYYLTRRNEVGGGITFSLAHAPLCSRVIDQDGHVVSEHCDSFTDASVGFSGFYRFNFAREGARGFPFVGGSISVGDVTTNFTGNWKARPHVGYKYFLSKRVGLDFSFGYDIDVNKVRVSNTFFNNERQSNLDGQIGLTFLF
jgi:hypothetical protein